MLGMVLFWTTQKMHSGRFLTDAISIASDQSGLNQALLGLSQALLGLIPILPAVLVSTSQHVTADT